MTFSIALFRIGQSKPYFEKTFTDQPQVVRIGVDPTSHVPLPMSLASPDSEEEVRWRHCTLIYTGAAFRLDFEGDADVYVGGSPTAAISLCDPFVGRRESVDLRMGRPVSTPESLNPVVRITRSRQMMARLSKMAGAKRRGPKRASTDLVERIRTTEGAQGRMGAMLSVVAAIAFFGALFGVAALARPQPAGPFADMDPWLASVVVMGVSREGGANEFTPIGTGWLCCGNGSDRGVQVVTNRHVRAELSRRAASGGETMRVVAFLPGVQSKDTTPRLKPMAVDITSAVSGPSCGGSSVALPMQAVSALPIDAAGSAADTLRASSPASDLPPLDVKAPAQTAANLASEWRCHPLFETFAADFGAQGRSAANVYDVAIVRLDEAASAHVRHEKRPMFAVAASLEDTGAPVAVIGYPTENLPYALNAADPVPKTYTGQVVRRTNPFLGSVQADAESTVPDLYAVRAESAGGLSGSPIIERTKSGAFAVVGMVMGASFTEASLTSAGARRQSASDIAYGLGGRAILDVVGNGSAADADRMRGVWSGMARYDARPALVVASDAFHERAAQAGCLATVTSPKGVILSKSSKGGAGRHSTEVRFDANELVWVLATARDGGDDVLVLKSVRKREGAEDEAATAAGFGAVRFEGRRGPVAGIIEVEIAGPRRGVVDLTVFRAKCGG